MLSRAGTAGTADVRELFTAPGAIPCQVDDAGLLDGARRGDSDAFSRLFARFQGPIFRYVAHMCGRDAADDVVQETFLAVLRRPEGYDSARGTVAGYLFGIARHFVLKRMTSHEVAALAEEIEERSNVVALAEDTVLDTLTRAETVDTVRRAIRSLPAAYREAVVLCELQEMSYAAAATIIQCPIGTVRSRLHRARVLLVERLSATESEAGLRK